MRMRRKTGILEKLAASPEYIIFRPSLDIKGYWKKAFGNENPLYVEIGSGKGRFITSMALKYPHINFIGLEREPEIVAHALAILKKRPVNNIRLILADGENLAAYLAPGEIERLFLNFSDPWPKKRHTKRRLTHPVFLNLYKTLFKGPGEIHLKTDNLDFFEYSLLAFAENGFSLRRITYDLHQSPWTENVMTEYEEKFSLLGRPICRCEAVCPS